MDSERRPLLEARHARWWLHEYELGRLTLTPTEYALLLDLAYAEKDQETLTALKVAHGQ